MLCANVATHARDAAADVDGVRELDARIVRLAGKARRLALDMEFGFLVEPDRQLLSIGFRIAERVRDSSCYDLLASRLGWRASSPSPKATCRFVIGSGWGAC